MGMWPASRFDSRSEATGLGEVSVDVIQAEKDRHRSGMRVASAVAVLLLGSSSLGLVIPTGHPAVAASDESGVFVSSEPLAEDWLEPTGGEGAGGDAPPIAEPLVGGSPAASSEFPWMAFLAIEKQSGDIAQCGGSLIAPRWVLTAAHCVADSVSVGAIVGRTTAPTSLSDPDFVFAARSFTNAGYMPGAFGVADVALVELREASSAQPIYLAKPGNDQFYTAGTMATLTGWGLTSLGGQSSDVLLRGEFPIRSSSDCLAAYPGFNASFNTCAGFSSAEASQPVGSCSGDSGGPLFVRSSDTQSVHQVGTVSYGVGECTTLTRPGVYMRVSAYYDGINDLVGGLPTPAPPVVVERWAGSDRYATSVRISQAAFSSGADTVFLATGQSFPDALSAGPAAATLNAPILLTSANQLPSAVSAELKRLNPSTVYLLGGSAAISAAVEAQVDAATTAQVRRIAGNDRYATGAAITELAFPTADVVYVAAGAGFADALSAGAPGGILRRPVLLTANTSVPSVTRAQITRLGNPDIIVLGGTAAVNSSALSELDALTTGTVKRVSGANRYATSVAVSADAFTTADTVFLATGTTFPDALGAAPAAMSLGGPILLTTPACAPAEVISEVARLGATRVIALGGQNAISNAAASLTQCAASPPNPTQPPPPPPPPSTPTITTLQPGTTLIGSGAPAGRYIAQAGAGCYWERLSGLGGTLGETITNDFQPFAGPAIVDIRSTDLAFSFDADCGTFKTYTPPPAPATAIGPGAWVVGSDILPGTYMANASDGCYWERAESFEGTFASIIANDFMSTGGAAFVTIAPTDIAFKTDDDCGPWTRIG